MTLIAAFCGLYCAAYVATVFGAAVLFDRPRKRRIVR